jgi:predicted nucleic acid-binding protein
VTAYVDSSALLKRYVDEVDSDVAEQLLASDPVLATSWITVVEVRRNLARLLTGSDPAAAQAQFTTDLDALAMISCDEAVATMAGDIGEALGVRSLDAVHLASAKRLRIDNLAFITFDIRQAQAARSMGLHVLGA